MGKTRHSTKHLPPVISASFRAHKDRILASLSVPESSYSDLSPKGSIDARIRHLIDAINTLDGVVTTSSCSGRVAVFVQGVQGKGQRRAGSGDEDEEGGGESKDVQSRDLELRFPLEREREKNSATPGGQGFDGHWMFVSHDPLEVELESEPESDTITGDGSVSHDEDARAVVRLPDELRPLVEGHAGEQTSGPEPGSGSGLLSEETIFNANNTRRPRLINLTFEPLILHICCATLAHAKPLLALALDAGFRESGLQSLKCLEHADAWPMVAVRTAGLAFSTVVGVLDGHGRERGVVGKGVLQFMLGVANDRFVENERRTARVRSGVEALLARQQEALRAGGVHVALDEDVHVWEDKHARAARKKAEGLEKRDHVQQQSKEEDSRTQIVIDDDDASLGFGLESEAG